PRGTGRSPRLSCEPHHARSKVRGAADQLRVLVPRSEIEAGREREALLRAAAVGDVGHAVTARAGLDEIELGRHEQDRELQLEAAVVPVAGDDVLRLEGEVVGEV